jgi:hypothetical protein
MSTGRPVVSSSIPWPPKMGFSTMACAQCLWISSMISWLRRPISTDRCHSSSSMTSGVAGAGRTDTSVAEVSVRRTCSAGGSQPLKHDDDGIERQAVRDPDLRRAVAQEPVVSTSDLLEP